MLAAASAYFIKGLCGFANTLVFTSILSFGAASANISPIDLLLGYPTNMILTWKNRKKLDPKVYLPLAAMVLAAYVSRVTESGGSFKANISAAFIADNTFRIVLYSVLGLLTFDTLKFVLTLLPFALLGLFAGMKCSSRMDEKLVRKITSVLLVLPGISLILKNL